MSKQNKNKVLLTILDGWGETTDNPQFNAIEVGKTPNWHRIVKENINANLVTFGLDVGLPSGQMGNSEVGHTNIGAGRVVFQELPKINMAIKNGEFATNLQITESIKQLKISGGTMHILGLYSNGGVHSHLEHLLYSAELFAKAGVSVNLHLFTDGRDTPPQSAISFLSPLNDLLNKYANMKIASVSGRYYAMDRDNRWERVELAYNAITSGNGETHNSIEELLDNAYKNNITDEFIKPAVINSYSGMKDNDSLFMINFRTDRAREILDALVMPNFTGFPRKKIMKLGYSLGMVGYSESLQTILNIVFSSNNLENTLGEWLAKENCSQLRVAETEKYPHVTFFFSGGREVPFNKEDRLLVPSPKVATYDLQPEMSAPEITEKLVNAISSENYDFIVVNYANGDMVGHTGIIEAAAKATETVDNALLELEKAVKEHGYIWLIIADHGNCEKMWDEINQVPHTQHTTNLVKAVLLNHGLYGNISELNNGKLADIAPTILALMNLSQPSEMDGISLLKK